MVYKKTKNENYNNDERGVVHSKKKFFLISPESALSLEKILVNTIETLHSQNLLW